MTVLKDADLQEICAMKKFGLLQHLDVSKLHDVKMPTCIIVCSDGFQRNDINLHLSKIWNSLEAEELIHEFKDNGLPLKAVNSKVVNPDFKTNVSLLNSIHEALGMKRIESRIINLSHYPCGIAEKNNLSLRDCMELLVRSRFVLRSAFNEKNLNVSVAMQVDFTTANCGKDRNTYHIETSVWPEYSRKVGYDPGNLFNKTASAH